ncbi:hypothetical protein DFJ73DRAFT_958927 [Zopfochytrium polystomum]|nr:hypothetical protein DFJ73DRAFT_958927 [Zopfochytrium polystomum]
MVGPSMELHFVAEPSVPVHQPPPSGPAAHPVAVAAGPIAVTAPAAEAASWPGDCSGINQQMASAMQGAAPPTPATAMVPDHLFPQNMYGSQTLPHHHNHHNLLHQPHLHPSSHHLQHNYAPNYLPITPLGGSAHFKLSNLPPISFNATPPTTYQMQQQQFSPHFGFYPSGSRPDLASPHSAAHFPQMGYGFSPHESTKQLFSSFPPQSNSFSPFGLGPNGYAPHPIQAPLQNFTGSVSTGFSLPQPVPSLLEQTSLGLNTAPAFFSQQCLSDQPHLFHHTEPFPNDPHGYLATNNHSNHSASPQPPLEMPNFSFHSNSDSVMRSASVSSGTDVEVPEQRQSQEASITSVMPIRLTPTPTALRTPTPTPLVPLTSPTTAEPERSILDCAHETHDRTDEPQSKETEESRISPTPAVMAPPVPGESPTPVSPQAPMPPPEQQPQPPPPIPPAKQPKSRRSKTAATATPSSVPTMDIVRTGLTTVRELIAAAKTRTAFILLSSLMDAVTTHCESLGLSQDGPATTAEHETRLGFWRELNALWLLSVAGSRVLAKDEEAELVKAAAEAAAARRAVEAASREAGNKTVPMSAGSKDRDSKGGKDVKVARESVKGDGHPVESVGKEHSGNSNGVEASQGDTASHGGRADDGQATAVVGGKRKRAARSRTATGTAPVCSGVATRSQRRRTESGALPASSSNNDRGNGDAQASAPSSLAPSPARNPRHASPEPPCPPTAPEGPQNPQPSASLLAMSNGLLESEWRSLHENVMSWGDVLEWHGLVDYENGFWEADILDLICRVGGPSFSSSSSTASI